jgi:hypothetical protein
VRAGWTDLLDHLLGENRRLFQEARLKLFSVTGPDAGASGLFLF